MSRLRGVAEDLWVDQQLGYTDVHALLERLQQEGLLEMGLALGLVLEWPPEWGLRPRYREFFEFPQALLASFRAGHHASPLTAHATKQSVGAARRHKMPRTHKAGPALLTRAIRQKHSSQERTRRCQTRP
jgi:hypothetical protein